MSSNKIVIVGLGYLGLPQALAFGEKLNAFSFDINKDIIKVLQIKNDKDLLSNIQFFYISKKIKFLSNKQELKIC